MIRKASAIWRGGLKDGKGTFSMGSGVLSNVSYTFAERFEDKPGTNPEELIAAALASCYSMKLSAVLGASNLTPESVDTKATLTFEKTDKGFTTTGIHLDVTAKVPGAKPDVFAKAAEESRTGCPIASVLKTNITVEARLA
jgi:osmotically inducible protein OsmC